jgi:hypothetical protein
MFNDFAAHRGPRLEELVRHHLRLTRGKTRVNLESPTEFSGIHIDLQHEVRPAEPDLLRRA